MHLLSSKVKNPMNECIRLREGGDYQSAYNQVIEARKNIKRMNIAPSLECKVLIESARCAYYLTKFEEAQSYISSLKDVLIKTPIDNYFAE